MNSAMNRRVVFLHMQKTGGSDIAAQFYLGRFGKYFFPEDLRAAMGFLPMDVLDRYRFFYGHSYRKHEIDNIPGEKFVFTFLRDPVERIVSHYEWLASYKLDIESRVIPQPETIPIKAMSCDDFFQSSAINLIDGFNNYFTRTIYEFFSDTQTNDVDLMLETSIRKLEEFDFIGMLDNYAASLDCLGRMLDIRFDDPASRPKVNATGSLPGENEFHEGGQYFKVGRETLASIRRRNWADIELYRRARQLAEERFNIQPTRVISGFSTHGILHKGYDGNSLYIDVAGYLQFGPYERLNAGVYAVAFSLRRAEFISSRRDAGDDVVVAILDIVGFDGEAREFARREVTWGEIHVDRFTSFDVHATFELPVSRLECRIYATGICELQSPLSVHITSERCISETQPEPLKPDVGTP